MGEGCAGRSVGVFICMFFGNAVVNQIDSKCIMKCGRIECNKLVFATSIEPGPVRPRNCRNGFHTALG